MPEFPDPLMIIRISVLFDVSPGTRRAQRTVSGCLSSTCRRRAHDFAKVAAASASGTTWRPVRAAVGVAAAVVLATPESADGRVVTTSGPATPAGTDAPPTHGARPPP